MENRQSSLLQQGKKKPTLYLPKNEYYFLENGPKTKINSP
jgi:hypothetical protein